MTKINTNYSIPNRSIFPALWKLSKALSSGINARLIKMNNEDCENPIKIENTKELENFRNYKSTGAYLQTRQDILDNTSMSIFEKKLRLENKTCFGTKEAVECYYTTGNLSVDNFKGIGVSHIVRVEDIIRFWECHPNDKRKRGATLKEQFYTEEGHKKKWFYDNYVFKNPNRWIIMKFKRKVWVIETLKGSPTKIPFLIKTINWISYPLKFIPKKSILKMDKYTNYSFRIGSIVNGYCVEIQIPNKFSFNN